VTTAADGDAGPVLEVTGLRQRFGDLVAVDNLDVQVRGGEIVGLVGRNGAGKTTTMRAVMGILRPTAGRISWRGRSVGHADRMRFGYMPEERGLYPQMRVLDQVAYFGELHGLDRQEATRRAQEWLSRLDLDDRADDQVIALSHGNQQRVQLVVALVHEPELLVLDEPFAGLDPSAVLALSARLRDEARRGTAILFSSHQLDLVERICDRIVILDEGRVVAEGSLDELQAQAPRRLRVKVDGPVDWVEHVQGTSVVAEDTDGVVLSLEPGTDPQAVLRAAQSAGSVEHFAYESGGLIDLYQELVAR
jgi:ABC-2 type transport system ATP-binding protein